MRGGKEVAEMGRERARTFREIGRTGSEMQGGEGGNCSVLMERTDRNLRGWKVGLARDVFERRWRKGVDGGIQMWGMSGEGEVRGGDDRRGWRCCVPAAVAATAAA